MTRRLIASSALFIALALVTASARADESPPASPAPTPSGSTPPATAPAPTEAAPSPTAPAGSPADPAAGPTATPASPEPAAAAAQPTTPAPPQRRNRSLEYAKELVQKGRYENALKELETAAQLPGNTPRELVEMTATRAQALLLQKKPNPAAARDLIVEILHSDPDATVLADAPEAVKAIVDQIRADQPLVLHDRIAVTRAGRPIKIKARIIDPKSAVAGVTLHFKGHHVSTWSTEPLRKDLSGYSGFIRNPEVLAPGGVTDDFVIDYFLTAENAAGQVVDSNGDDDVPISMEVSSTKAEASLMGGEAQPLPPLDLTPKPVEPAAPEVAETPWYLRWYSIAGAGVILAGAIAVTAVALSAEDPLPPTVLIIDLGGGK